MVSDQKVLAYLRAHGWVLQVFPNWKTATVFLGCWMTPANNSGLRRAAKHCSAAGICVPFDCMVENHCLLSVDFLLRAIDAQKECSFMFRNYEGNCVHTICHTAVKLNCHLVGNCRETLQLIYKKGSGQCHLSV